MDLYAGWDHHNALVEKMIAPLSEDQLSWRPADHMWSVRTLANHIVAVRAWWYGGWMVEGGQDLARFIDFDENEGSETRQAEEIVAGLRDSWAGVAASMRSWTEADMAQEFLRPIPDLEGRRRSRSRQWIIWHVAEHDVHHAGEISLILGMHGLTGLDL
jgi:uncharacterized damage-inducible protein DinB